MGTVFDIDGVQEGSTRSVDYPRGGLTVNTGERKERRGFASMSPEKQREIASKGGRAAHEKGTAHDGPPTKREMPAARVARSAGAVAAALSSRRSRSRPATRTASNRA